ncbi:curli-like amyloid fiber formation chaperone CsgH [Sulfitobacter sp. HNIBRBA3233]|uniref:curli-like amyloid fiber formation chaperone CsgH n=1 Tax=Sulfitobacter marinivivus TaxID=3158558 RepID=UPI0032E0432D
MIRSLVLGLVTTLASVSSLSAGSTLALPDIEITPQDTGLLITGHVNGLGDGTVTATLTIDKSDASGRAKTSQSRKIPVSNGSSDTVAQTSLSAQDDLSLRVTLELSADGAPIGIATTTLGAPAE